jgi:hypothetical protein
MPERTKTIGVGIDVPLDRIDDLIAAAFGGGSTYWIESVDVLVPAGVNEDESYGSVIVTHDGVLAIVPLEDTQRYLLDLFSIVRGVILYAAETGEWVLSDEVDIDAANADSVLQYALFGELVYG